MPIFLTLPPLPSPLPEDLGSSFWFPWRSSPQSFSRRLCPRARCGGRVATEVCCFNRPHFLCTSLTPMGTSQCMTHAYSCNWPALHNVRVQYLRDFRCRAHMESRDSHCTTRAFWQLNWTNLCSFFCTFCWRAPSSGRLPVPAEHLCRARGVGAASSCSGCHGSAAGRHPAWSLDAHSHCADDLLERPHPQRGDHLQVVEAALLPLSALLSDLPEIALGRTRA